MLSNLSRDNEGLNQSSVASCCVWFGLGYAKRTIAVSLAHEVEYGGLEGSSWLYL